MKNLKSNRGLATIEVLPLLIIFIILFSYGLGLFGFIHTGILHSIAARNYAFELIRNRSNIVYFEGGNTRGAGSKMHFKDIGYRLFGIQSSKLKSGAAQFIPEKRNIAFGPAFATEAVKAHKETGEIANSAQDHLDKVNAIGLRNRSIGVSPGWVMVAYGICLDAECGQ
jgi:hypothetical protein